MIVGSFPYSPGFNPYQRLFTEALETAGCDVVRVPPQKWFPLSKACRQPVDVLHLDWHHDWYQGKNFVTRSMKNVMYRHGLRSCRQLPVVWTAHNLTSHDSLNPRLDHDCTQRLIKACRGVVVMSKAAETLLRSEFGVPDTTRVQRIYHGHYIDFYANAITRPAAREQLIIEADEFVYLALGALRPYKGHLDLIRAFASIAAPSDRLVIAGSALHKDYVSELKDCIADVKRTHADLKIDLYDRTIVDDEMQVFFKAADVCVLPFQRILNSGSLLLAMSFGKPVVAPNLGSIPEVAQPESFVGYDPANSRGLANSLCAAREKFKHPSIETSVIDFTRRKYNWNRVGTQLRELYTELLNC